jgi:hypothetical protein
MPAFDGLIPLPAVSAAILKITGSEADPVSRARVRYRLLWKAVKRQPDLAVRIGERLFILDQEAKLRDLAAALGMTVAAPARKASRSAKVARPSSAAAAA